MKNALSDAIDNIWMMWNKDCQGFVRNNNRNRLYKQSEARKNRCAVLIDANNPIAQQILSLKE